MSGRLDYSKLSFDELAKGKFDDNRSYLVEYRNDFRSIMGQDPCVNCGKKYQEYQNFKSKLSEMADVKNSGFKLKEMYNGIPLSRDFGSKDFVSNATLDDEKAKKLITEHPKGVELFSQLPKDFKIEDLGSEEVKSERHLELEKMSAGDVKELAIELEISPKTKAENILAIIEKEKELSA